MLRAWGVLRPFRHAAPPAILPQPSRSPAPSRAFPCRRHRRRGAHAPAGGVRCCGRHAVCLSRSARCPGAGPAARPHLVLPPLRRSPHVPLPLLLGRPRAGGGVALRGPGWRPHVRRRALAGGRAGLQQARADLRPEAGAGACFWGRNGETSRTAPRAIRYRAMPNRSHARTHTRTHARTQARTRGSGLRHSAYPTPPPRAHPPVQYVWGSPGLSRLHVAPTHLHQGLRFLRF
jgi:hypothetical protein